MKDTLLLYIEPNKCSFQLWGLPSSLQLSIPWEIAHDGEIMDKEKFTALFQTFLQTNSISQTSVAIVLSPQMTFEKNLSQGESSNQPIDAQGFIESIPFENVIMIRITLDKTDYIVATNKDIVDLYKNILTAQHCTVILAVPETIFQQFIPQLQESPDLQIMLEKLDIMHEYSFLKNENLQLQSTGQQLKSKQNPLRLIVLTGVFIILIIIISIMLLKKI